MAQLIVGDIAPRFDLPRDGGGMVSLAALFGSPVALFFYPKDDTSSCTVEAQDFSRLKPEFDRAGVALFGISPDAIKKHERFKTKYQLTVDLLADPNLGTLQAYGVWGEKSLFGVSYTGVERTSFLLRPDLRVERIWRKVRVKGHAQEVLEAARALT